MLERRLSQPPAVGIDRNVCLAQGGICAERFTLSHDASACLDAVRAVDKHARTLLGQHARCGGADTAGRSGNDCDSSSKLHRAFLLACGS
jgi:hypothetical protein